ncbi:MAG: DUF4276 family protein [Symploca sp. SIO2E6]|nr:DUF4276 family protein [Symploca sp. SIO2E6]
MVKAIRIYIEGDPELRQGFRTFLQPLYDLAQNKKIKIEPPKLCGSRNAAYKAFKVALKTYPDAFIVLLVDSEGPVDKKQTPWQYLNSRDGWDSLGTDDQHCHLMVQTMEAWFLADINALRQYYGQKLQESAVPKNPNIEEIDKVRLESSLEAATRHTSKGQYHKTRHASKLLELLKVDKVRKASRYCDRFFITLTQVMGETI